MDEMARSRGVDVCFDEDMLRAAPHCPHGPTLLFERHVVGKTTPRKFYACSASRDRKQCSFFRWANEKRVNNVTQVEAFTRGEDSTRFSVEDRKTRLEAFKADAATVRRFCHTCNILLMRNEWSGHVTHDMQLGVSDDQVAHPTTLLRPLNNDKTNAQYLFTDKTADFLARLSLTPIRDELHILCIGTPKLFETLRGIIATEKIEKVRCLLLDIDHRLGQFYSAQEFCQYNMFNHHFFQDGHGIDRSSYEGYRAFMSIESDMDFNSKDLLVVIDPPFGGLVEVISFTLRRITEDFSNGCLDKNQGSLIPNPTEPSLVSTIWIFPYFMESRITTIQMMVMLDYKVEYDNHAHFRDRSKGGSKNGSPVRVFTNLESVVVLPAQEGYRLCVPCKRYVSPENAHCTVCNACTTKVGRTYVHCALCKRCVKPSWTHCADCDTCEIPGRHSGTLAKTTGCHVCGELGHKRRDCPNKQHQQLSGDDGQSTQKQQQQSSRKQRHAKKRKRSKKAQDCSQKQDVEKPEIAVEQSASKRSNRKRKKNQQQSS